MVLREEGFQVSKGGSLERLLEEEVENKKYVRS